MRFRRSQRPQRGTLHCPRLTPRVGCDAGVLSPAHAARRRPLHFPALLPRVPGARPWPLPCLTPTIPSRSSTPAASLPTLQFSAVAPPPLLAPPPLPLQPPSSSLSTLAAVPAWAVLTGDEGLRSAVQCRQGKRRGLTREANLFRKVRTQARPGHLVLALRGLGAEPWSKSHETRQPVGGSGLHGCAG